MKKVLILSCVLAGLMVQAAELIRVAPGFPAKEPIVVNAGEVPVLDGASGAWFASEPVGINPRLTDWKDGSVSFAFYLLALPSGEQKLFVAGDIGGKKLETLRIAVTPDGRIRANHYSWHNRQSWLDGVESSPLIRPLEWNSVRYSWGKNGQRLVINGKEAAARPDQVKDVSWAFNAIFPASPTLFAAAEMNGSGENGTVPPQPDGLLTGDAGKLFAILKRAPELEARLESQEKKFGRRLPYERSRLAILRHFAGTRLLYLMKDGRKTSVPDIHQPEKQDVAWLIAGYPEFERHLSALESGKVEPLASPRVIADKKRTSYADGAFRQDGRPVFLIGTQDAFGLNPEVGFCATGWTFSPRWEFPSSPDQLRSSGNAHVKRAREAAANGQFWDELYSFHARPGWLTKQNPKLLSGLGFIGHDITHHYVRGLDRRTLESVLPKLAETDNFLFFDLANEPAFNGVTELGAKEFREFLKERHRTLAAVNAAWGSSFRSFDEIDIPAFVNRGWRAHNRQTRPSGELEQRQYIDWSDYNCRRVNDFFRRLSDWCHELSPKTLTYTKMVSSYWPTLGIDPVMNVRTTDLSGSDAWWVYQGASGPVGASDEMSGGEKVKSGYSVGWQRSLMHYDMLRSARPDAPIVNAEDHQFADGFTPLSEKRPEVPAGHWDMPLPAEHFFSGQWQQAVHGKGLSLIWMHWPRHNVRDRAVATWGNSKAALDLNRLANEVNALQTVRPKVRLLVSRNAELWSFSQKNRYWNKLTDVYEALSLNGIPLGFVFEEDLAAGKKPECELLIAPYANQVDAAALATLKRSGVRIAALGDASLQFDRYNRKHPAGALPRLFRLIDEAAFEKKPLETMRELLDATGTGPEFRVLTDGRPAERIEWRSAALGGRTLLNLCNYGQESVTAEIDGAAGSALDLVSMEPVSLKSFRLGPEQVRLLVW